MKTKEGHSNLIDWLPILGCISITVSPWVLKLFKPEVIEWHNIIGMVERHQVEVSLLGIIGFLSVVLCHSLSDYDDLAERISFKRADGMWIRINDRFSGIYKVTGTKIEGDFPAGIWDHKIEGHYDSNQKRFLIKTIRQRPDGASRAVLLGTLEVLNEDTLKTIVYSSDGGHSDVPVGWTELAYFERVRGSLALPTPSTIVNVTLHPRVTPPSSNPDKSASQP